MLSRSVRVTLLLLLCLWLPSNAGAHEVRPAIATALISDDNSLLLEITLNLEAVMAGIEPDHADTSNSKQAPTYDRLRALKPQLLNQEFNAFRQSLLSGISVGAAGVGPIPLGFDSITVPEVGDLGQPRYSTVMLKGVIPNSATQLMWKFNPEFGDSVIRLKTANAPDLLHAQYVMTGETSVFSLGVTSDQKWTAVFIDYVVLGFVHILPKGLDHILFVVGLFLLSTRMSALLWQISAFTVAHSITLALGVTGVVTISPAITEPLIALSIAYIAVENLFTSRLQPWRPAVIFGFGLLHGLGFASVLQEIGLSTTHFITGLIAFNVGVELGQLAVIIACFILVGWGRRFPSYRRWVVLPASLVITGIAMYWFVERLSA